MAQEYKRRLIPIVDQQFQLKYTAIIVACAAVISTMLGFLLLRAYQDMNAMVELLRAVPDVGERLNKDDAVFVFRLSLGFLIAEVVFLGMMGLVVTHRVAGPVYVIKSQLDYLLDGVYPPTRQLRTHDEFKEAFASLSTLIERMRARDASEAETLRVAAAAARAGGLEPDALGRLEAMLTERDERLRNDASAT